MNSNLFNIFQDVKDMVSILYPDTAFANFKEAEEITNEDLFLLEDYAEDIIKEVNKLKGVIK